MASTETTDPVLEDLAGVVWRLWEAADRAFVAAGSHGDLALDMLEAAARGAAFHATAFIGEHLHLCDRPASTSTQPAQLVREAEQVLASRPIEQWPSGTSSLIVEICDLIREHRL